MFEIRKSDDRGQVKLGWLSSHHTFSFGHYYDPEQMGFSDLLVINDDYVQPAKGFDTHGHRDMEIITYVLSGALAHKDSMGTGSVIRPGDVQMMSAGAGILHSEFNDSKDEEVHFLQIWLVPNRMGAEPRYQQTFFSVEQKRGKLCLILSSEGEQGSLSLYQDAKIYAGLFDGAEQAILNLPKDRYVYVHLARGELQLNGQLLQAGDGARVRNETQLIFSQAKDAEVLVFDLRANELPER